MSYSDEQKTNRIAILCCTVIALGFFMLIDKTHGCEHSAESCQDSFHEFDVSEYRRGEYNHSCDHGARAEIVTTPKMGILCHCVNNQSVVDAGSFNGE